MKSALINSFGNIEEIIIGEIDIPLLKKDELLIEVYAAGLNPKDILIRKGKFKVLTGSRFPQQIGFEISGVVKDANNSTKYKKGDRIFGMINGWKGRCCSEYLNILENELYYMPKNISFEEASGVSLVGQTVLQALRDRANMQRGYKVCINGASGGVGTLAIQIAKDLGGEVTAITSYRNMDFCKSLGADHVVDYSKKDITKLDEKFDVFFDVFGNYSLKRISEILNKNGRYVTTIPKMGIFKEEFLNFFRRKKSKLIIVKSRSEDLKWLCDKIEKGKIKPVVDKIFPLVDIRMAQKYIESKRAKGKVIIKIKDNNTALDL